MKNIILLVLVFFSSHSILAQTETINKDLLGRNVSEFEFFDIENNEFSLESFTGNYIYIDFWSSWCKPCIAEFTPVKELKEILKGQNIVFVNISRDHDIKKWKEAITKYNVIGINLWTGPLDRFKSLDTINNYFNELDINTIPRYWIVNPEGVIINSDAARPSENLENNQLLSMIKKDTNNR